MPPQLALVLVLTCILGALVIDSVRPPRMSLALWVPTTWSAILASRPLSAWLDSGAASLGANAEDGSPFDRAILVFLLVTAIVILIRRKLPWVEWFKRNKWLLAFFIYCGVSIVWSDFPGIALRRWIRALGGVTMILVVLSEEDPIAALAALVRRFTYVLVPLSILLIKYYRERGVIYDSWTGEQIIVGIATDKNALGRLCLIAGLFAVWEIITVKNNPHVHKDKLNRLASLVVFSTTLWLLKISDSKTALVSILIGSSILMTLSMSIVRKRVKHLGVMMLLAVTVLVTVSLSFGLAEQAASSLGRNLTLTDRTLIWADLLGMRSNPLVGVGYDSFWLGARLQRFVQKFRVTSAHNGYLEVYLELGAVGLTLFACFLVGVFLKAKKSLTADFDYGRLRVAFLVIYLLYNVTESGYKATTAIFWVLLLVAVEFPARLASTGPAEAVTHRWSPRTARSPLPATAPATSNGIGATTRPLAARRPPAVARKW